MNSILKQLQKKNKEPKRLNLLRNSVIRINLVLSAIMEQQLLHLLSEKNCISFQESNSAKLTKQSK